MLILDTQYLALVKKILATHIPGQTVWVYGSRIKGCAHEGSDLDLVIIDNHENITNEQISSLRSAFSESNLPILVDLLIWSEIPSEFKSEIEKTHEVLQ
ncbi:MAG: nucleotidyltransferase domain-containing protein [Legionella longbeachae]|nr:nucleotidyltransferase domain-containing protein [Legionella longbeachae]